MPRKGFKSITLSEIVYDKFYAQYQNEKEIIMMQGVFSFSAFITFKLNQILTKEKSKHE